MSIDKPKVTPKDFFLWIAAMIAFYVSVFSFIALLFDYINYAFPDVLNYYVDPYSGSIRYEIASILVLFPVFLVLMRLIRNDIQRVPEKKDLWIRRWALFLVVFIAGATIVGDLITLINYFLGGEITTRFLLKVLVVLLVAGGGFLHFLADIRGYWVQFPERARMVGYGVALLVLATIASGFFIMGTPSQIRMFRLDDQKVGDLQNIQYQVVNYWQLKQELPADLVDLEDPISGFIPPRDPQTGDAYRYEKIGNLSFRLCAAFNAESRAQSSAVRAMPYEPIAVMNGKGGLTNENVWQHGAGEQCFDRTIDPEKYPPITRAAIEKSLIRTQAAF